jgi:hypothetical protein
MNVRIVSMFLRLQPQLKIWRKVVSPVLNVTAKRLKDFLTDLVIAIKAEAALLPETATQLLHEEQEMPVLCKRAI